MKIEMEVDVTVLEKMLDDLYADGYFTKGEKDYDPRASEAWQSLFDLFIKKEMEISFLKKKQIK